jgi:anti-sigma B factor antagonist
MDITANDQNSVTVVSIQGSVDSMTAEAFLKAMQSYLSQGKSRLIGDLSGVNYTSSAGLRAILATLKESRQNGGDFRLAAVQPTVLKVLELSGFTSILKIYPTTDQAVASFATEG